MPYVRKEPRAILDPLLKPIVDRIRAEAPNDRAVAARRAISAVASRYVQILYGDVAGVPEASLVRAIHERFVLPEQKGNLNYCFTRIAVGAFVPHYPCSPQDWPYSSINDVLEVFDRAKLSLNDAHPTNRRAGVCIGALNGAAFEFYCRVAVPKERKARIENGDLPEYAAPDAFP